MDDSHPIIDVTPHPTGYSKPAGGFRTFLRRRKGAIAFFWIAGLFAAFWWLFTLPVFYRAESRVMIVRLGSGGPVSEAELASEIELVREPTHLSRAAANFLHSPTDALIHTVAETIDARLAVAPSGKSNVIAVAYHDADPSVAARIANQIVELYLADRRFIFQLNGQPAAARGSPSGSSDASAAADALSAFDVVNHGSQLHAELQSRVQHRVDLEAHLAEFKAQIRDNQETAKALHKRSSSLPDRIQSRTRTRSSTNPSDRFAEQTEVLNPLKQQIESELFKIDATVAGLEARLAETTNALRDARAAERQTSALASERDKLERKAVDARGVPESATAAAPAERPTLRATLINRAEAPYAPESRHFWFWIPTSIVITLGLALLFAWLIDQFDKPVYTPGDFERASGVPPMNDFAQGAGA